jgi:hypothetical protein
MPLAAAGVKQPPCIPLSLHRSLVATAVDPTEGRRNWLACTLQAAASLYNKLFNLAESIVVDWERLMTRDEWDHALVHQLKSLKSGSLVRPFAIFRSAELHNLMLVVSRSPCKFTRR